RLSFLMVSVRCNLNFNRTKSQQGLNRGKKIGEGTSEPRWHAIGAGIGGGVHAGAHDTAKRNLLSTVVDQTQIDLTDILRSGTELLPRAQGNFFAADAQRVSKVIAGALWDNQHRDSPGANLWQITVNGPITTEDEGGMGRLSWMNGGT